ncbi:MAG: EamA family transporter [Kofleriaceae bacterium]|nr:EamA family transporter [Kofleriaceae bacterium]
MGTSEPAAGSPSLPRPRIAPRLIGSLAAVYVIWSSTYLAMRVLVKTMPPLFSASLRFNIAGLVLLIIAFRRGSAWPSPRDWLRVLPIGALLFVGGNGFVSIAQLSVSSGGAAVVCASMPLWVGVLGFVTGERPSKREWTSLVVGFIGIMVLMGGPSLAGEPLHLVLIVAAPISWALGSILARRLPGPIGKDAFLLPAMEMITGGLALGVVAMFRGEQFPTHASVSAWLIFGYLLMFGSLLAFTAYNWLLRNARPVIATSYAYVNPVLAVILGAALSGEPLGTTTVAASVLMVGAIWLALRRPATTP